MSATRDRTNVTRKFPLPGGDAAPPLPHATNATPTYGASESATERANLPKPLIGNFVMTSVRLLTVARVPVAGSMTGVSVQRNWHPGLGGVALWGMSHLNVLVNSG